MLGHSFIFGQSFGLGHYTSFKEFIYAYHCQTNSVSNAFVEFHYGACLLSVLQVFTQPQQG